MQTRLVWTDRILDASRPVRRIGQELSRNTVSIQHFNLDTVLDDLAKKEMVLLPNILRVILVNVVRISSTTIDGVEVLWDRIMQRCLIIEVKRV